MYDCIVIGAGVVGSASAYQLAKRGQKVLLVEQFSIPHSRGSSHGFIRGTNMTQHLPHRAKMTRYSLEGFKELEKECGIQLFSKRSTLKIHRSTSNKDEYLLHVKTGGKDVIELTGKEANHKWPGLLSLPADASVAVTDDGGGLFRANKVIECYHNGLIKNGGIILDNEEVTSINPGPPAVVKTTKGEYQAKSVVVACGPWIKPTLELLGLNISVQVQRLNACFFQEKSRGIYNEMPGICDLTDAPVITWVAFNADYPGLTKFVVSTGEQCDPSKRDLNWNQCQSKIKQLVEFVKNNIPGLIPEPHIIEPCMVTTTPDGEIIIDHHPKHSHIVIAGGMSGRGFQIAPAVGSIVTDLVFGNTPSFDITTMRITRFPNIILD